MRSGVVDGRKVIVMCAAAAQKEAMHIRGYAAISIVIRGWQLLFEDIH